MSDVERQLAKQAETARRLRDGKTSEELLATEYPPIQWIVPGLILPGLTLLAGAPKTGKSWVALGMACAIACGGHVFGEIKVESREVLMLSLEDTERRIKDRLQKMWVRGSGKLHIRTRWPAGAECLRYIGEWMGEFPDTRAVVIDTLQKVMAIEDVNSYRETYAAGAALKKLADRHSIAIVAVHHTRKAQVGDFLNAVNGSVGLTGSADTIITMARDRMQPDGILSITGRDVEEREHGIHFDAAIGTWTLMDHVPKRKDPWAHRDGKSRAAGERDER